jgi:hypothetical protein
VVLLCVLTFLVQYYAACYDIRIKTMFGSSLPPVVCSKAHALVTYIDYVSNMAVSYRRQELLAHRGRLGSPPALVGYVLLMYLVFCVVLLYCLSSSCVFCALCCKFLLVVHS